MPINIDYMHLYQFVYFLFDRDKIIKRSIFGLLVKFFENERLNGV